MMENISFSLPLSGMVQYSTAALAGMLIGVIASRNGFASYKDVKAALQFQNATVFKTLLSAVITAVIAIPLLMEIHSFSIPQYAFFWQNLLGGIIAGIGLFLAGRTLFSALAAIGCGELHALWFLLGTAGTVFAFEEWDIKIGKLLKDKDFTTGRLASADGWDFFDLQSPGVWIAASAAVLLVIVSILSVSGNRDKAADKAKDKK